MKAILITAALSLCIFPPVALRASAGASPEPAPELTDAQLDSIERVFSLHEVVVTGTRTPKLLKDTPITTRLISAADLRSADPTNLQDLLQAEMPGVEFTYAMNQQTNMNVSGFAGQGVLVLLDGERLAGETMENVDFSRLAMSGVARIEVIKGAASALYGSNAAGGVINIITKDADRPWRVNVNVRGADHGEWRAGGEIANRSKYVSNVLDVNYSKIDTYTVCLNPSDECDFRHVYGNHTWNFQDRLTLRPFDGLTLRARAGYYFKERQYDPAIPDRYRDFTAGLRGNWIINDRNNLEVSYAFDQYDKSDYLKEESKDLRDYRNVQNTVRALYNLSLPCDLMLTFGSDVMRDYLDTYQFDDGARLQTTADVFAQADWTINSQWEVIGAVRYDYFSDHSTSHVTPKFGARFSAGRLTLRGGYAGGFRAPTLKERYMDFDMAGIFDIHGNPELKSEISHNLNLSAEYSWRNYNFTAAANYSAVHHRITTSGVRYGEDGTPYIDYINVPDMKVAGVDLGVQGSWVGGWSARVGYAYTHEEVVGNTITQYCPARPHSLNVRGGWSHEWTKNYRTELTVSGRFLSKVSYDSMYMYEPFDTRRITNPAYTLWKVQLAQTICKGALITVAVDNIFNYAPKVYSYNAPITLGANLMIGLSLDIDRFF